MSVKFSLLLPTRDRPKFVAQALGYISKQTYTDFEVIVSDNYTSASMSCKQQIEKVGLDNVKYIRPAAPMGMVENWNLALEHATGDYILCFTDKMFLLHNTLAGLAETVEKSGSELVSWVDDFYTPIDFDDHFGPGWYAKAQPDVPTGALYAEFDPLEELSRKGRSEVARCEQSKSQYSRGKICFGAFSSGLVARIRSKYGKLFQPISPDYTSMILGLSEAKSAVEYGASGIVHLVTKISNGMLCAEHDDVALNFLKQLGGWEVLLDGLFVPGLYSSVNSGVARDYLNLKRQYDLRFDFDPINWLVYCAEDVESPARIWSSIRVEESQKRLLAMAINDLNDGDKLLYRRRRETRNLERIKPHDLLIRAKRILRWPHFAWLYEMVIQFKNSPLAKYSDLHSAVAANSAKIS